MNHYDLTNEEEKQLQDFESGKLQSTPNLAKRKRELQSYAKNTLNKTKNINIRLSERDIHRLKTKAAEEGLPYQTLASSFCINNRLA
jgi:predicted DNA binding CopG/RHH family protein